MKLFSKIHSATMLFLLVVTGIANATEVHLWDKKPIEIRLEVGKERIITFPSNAKLGMSQDFAGKIRFTNAAGTLYIKALQAFNKTRVFATLDNGEMLLIDFFAVRPSKGNDAPEEFKIVHPDAVEKASEGLKKSEQEVEENSRSITIKQALQYAVIDLYGVKRLLPNLAITESEIKKPLNLKHVFINGSAGLFELNAFKQYRTTNYTVTAVHLRNRTHHKQYIRLVDVYPAMLVSSSFDTYVEARTEDPMQRDSTTFFIVTKKPLREYGFYSPAILKSNSNTSKDREGEKVSEANDE